MESEKNRHLWNEEEPQPIAVPLLGEHVKESSNKDYQLDYHFVGREHLIKELTTILKDTRNTRGCYLISGFRGSGKTRLIRKVLYFYKKGSSCPAWLPVIEDGNELDALEDTINRGSKELNGYISSSGNKSPERTSLCEKENLFNWFISKLKKLFSSRVITVKVNLGQDGDLSPREVLFNTTTLLYSALSAKKIIRDEIIQGGIIIIIVALLASFFFGIGFGAWFEKVLFSEYLPSWLHWLKLPFPLDCAYIPLFVGSCVISSAIYYWLCSRLIATNTHVIYLLRQLNKRMAYAVEVNSAIKSYGYSFKRKASMPPLDARQIENELLHILKECRKVPEFFRRPDVIFVFDELDKITYRQENCNQETPNQPSVGCDLYGRKKKVDDLLGGLKNFITHGSARFFFIAGREMLDSYQAERGSTSSLYESLFDRIFEVPSLLSDHSDHNNHRIHSLIEVYVCRKLMDPNVAIYLWLQYTNRNCENDPLWEKDLQRKLMYSPFCLRTYYHFLHFVGTKESIENFTDFSVDEFKDDFAIGALCSALERDGIKPETRSRDGTVEWLNDILLVDCDKKITAKEGTPLASEHIELLRKRYNESRCEADLKILNRSLLEKQYPQITPGIQRKQNSKYVGIEGREARRIVLGLRNFIQFLTLHSWGNPKRLESLFAHFTKPVDGVDWRQENNINKIKGANKDVQWALQFGLIDQQRIVLASNLYTQLYHDLGRQLASSGDKLIVSTMAAFQYILKFHRYPFCRYHFERMSETLSIYRSPELNTMIDTLVTKVLHPHIRRIRNSHYRYRFSGDFEQELRYISRVNDIESAAFNFSLDASAPIKSQYIEHLKALENREPSRGQDVIAIYELCMTIGDLFALEQSRDEAFTYYQKAVDILDKCPEGHVRFAHFHVEALLRLGEIYEERQRYDQAASIYIHARSIINKLGGSAGPELLEALRSGDSKWDIFRQPFWAYWFLQLKRSPASFRDKLPSRFEYPFKNNNNDDSVNCYRTGQLAFFYSCYPAAVGGFVCAINESKFLDEKEDSERTVYLGAYACLHLGESIFAGAMHYAASKTHDGTATAEPYKVEISGWMQSCKESPLDKFSFPGRLREIKEYISRLESITDNNFLEVADSYKTLCLMCHAAERLKERGLYHHASIAYLKVLSIWGMFAEIIFAIEEFDVTNNSDGEVAPMFMSTNAELLKESEGWIAEIRVRAAEKITFMQAGGYGRFQARWKGRDVSSFDYKKQSSSGGKTPLSPLSEKLNKSDLLNSLSDSRKNKYRLSNTSSIGFELKNTIDLLFSPDKISQNIYKDVCEKYSKSRSDNRNELDRIDREICENLCSAEVDSILHEPIFMQRSLIGQKLIYLSMWEYMAKVRYRHNRKPFMIPHQPMVPHSTRSLMFAHWLAGRRYLHWEVLDKLRNSSAGIGEYEAIKESAAKSVHNLHRAIYYIRQLSGSDQDIMFPDTSMVLYDLWRLLYALIDYKIKKEKSNFGKAIGSVKEELSSSKCYRHNSTPGNLYDFNNVTTRTIDALHDIEQLGDISNRVRTDAIKTRHFLADDYEDPRFHLDWTMAQMYGPTARILKQRVEMKSVELRS